MQAQAIARRVNGEAVEARLENFTGNYRQLWLVLESTLPPQGAMQQEQLRCTVAIRFTSTLALDPLTNPLTSPAFAVPRWGVARRPASRHLPAMTTVTL